MADRVINTEDKIRLANCDLRGFLKQGSKAENILHTFDINTYAELMDSDLPRKSLNVVLRSIPIEFRASLVGEYDYRVSSFGFHNGKKYICLLASPTRVIQKLLKIALNRVSKPRMWLPDVTINWNKIWLIKNPTLRACKFKLAHGDIFCNARRLRCGLADSDKCVICGEIETVSHQLFECTNSRRLWSAINQVLSSPIATIHDIVTTNGSVADEIVISTLIQALIQIDRSAKVPMKAIMMSAVHYIRIEKIVTNDNSLDTLLQGILNLIG